MLTAAFKNLRTRKDSKSLNVALKIPKVADKKLNNIIDLFLPSLSFMIPSEKTPNYLISSMLW